MRCPAIADGAKASSVHPTGTLLAYAHQIGVDIACYQVLWLLYLPSFEFVSYFALSIPSPPAVELLV